MLPDRIETGTYAMAVAMTGGDVLLEGARPELLQSGARRAARRPAPRSTADQRGHPRRRATAPASRRSRSRPQPFPGFPTDLQAQLMALMTRAKGTSRITETIFENRFMHVQELARLGAASSSTARPRPSKASSGCKGAPVMATDLRASVSLVIAGARRRGRDHGQPRLSPRPRLRAAGGQARPLRRRDRAHQRVTRAVIQPGAARAGPINPAGRNTPIGRARVATRQQRLDAFLTEGEPPADQPLQLLCEDHSGTYMPPFLCRWVDGAWRNDATGAEIEVTVLGWRTR